MLRGIEDNEIIAGAYTTGDGICPMLAAHRQGGRTSLISFAHAWDRFAFSGSRVIEPRPATARELLVLRSHLEASLLDEDAPTVDLGAAIEEHRELVSRHDQAARPRRRPRPGDRDRSRELRTRPGWSWTRLVRRYDEYQWALEQVQAEHQAQAAQDSPEHVPVPS
jgi:hypothetical protein